MRKLDNKSTRLTIRLSESERSNLKSKAKKFRLNEAEYVRKILDRDELQQIVIPEANQNTCHELSRLRIELNRQGINLNQLVKILHSQQMPSQIVSQLAMLVQVNQKLQTTINSYQSQLVGSNDDREN